MPVISDQVGLTLDRIVLATDFSPVSEAAAVFAEGLAKRFSSNLTLAHVVDLSVATRSDQAVVGLHIDDMRRNSAEQLEHLLGEAIFAGVRATAQTLEAHNPAAALVGLSEQLKADIIVTGTHARHGLEKAILGSCAEAIIRHASCPVLTIGPKVPVPAADAFSFHTVVFATDFSSGAAKQAATALAFAQDSVANIYLCHILKYPGEDISDTLGLHLKFEGELENLMPNSIYDWCSPECVVEQGKVAPHILDLAKKVGADLIVLGAKRSASWYAHLSEGTVGHVVANAECPVMTICSV